MRMTMEGIMSIQSRDNPRIVEQKLDVMLAPKLRGGSRERQLKLSKLDREAMSTTSSEEIGDSISSVQSL